MFNLWKFNLITKGAINGFEVSEICLANHKLKIE